VAVKPLANKQLSRVPQIIPGILLIAVWWPIAWLQLRPVSDYYFFPLWLGYILVVDSFVVLRTGTSLLSRSKTKFVLLFVSSIPFWWIFEWMNRYLDNWHYHSPAKYSEVVYVLLASISFATVVPAVLETAELLTSFEVGQRLPNLPAWRLRSGEIVGFHLLGWAMLALVLLFPHYTYPLAWLSVFFIIEPINALVGQRSIGHFVRQGRWSALWNVMLGTLVTGFFWEMWNFYSMPKWTYSVPFVGFGHLFEMPILGYSGYLPFGLEVFAIFGLFFSLFLRSPQYYARVGAEPSHADESSTGSLRARKRGQATAERG
jgi:hypothetical protein